MNQIKSSFVGHKGRCFDLRLSLDSLFLLSSSEDGACKLWNINTKKNIITLNHNNKAEVLRSIYLSSDTICTNGSDGNAIIWKLNDTNSNIDYNSNTISYSKLVTIPHNDQIYACTTMSCIQNPHIITASDNLLHIWDLSTEQDNSYSISFDPVNPNSLDNSQSAYGGPRNPDNKAFIFDVQPAYSTSTITSQQNYEGTPFSTTLALALSDGSIRLVDLRSPSEAHTFLITDEIEGVGRTHVTGITWSPDKLSIISSTGLGDLILFDLRMCGIRSYIHSAHSSTCFGSSFYSNTNQSLFVSWSSDGSLRTWDINTLQGEGSQSNCLKEIIIPDYPIFCATPNLSNNNEELIIGGGSSKQSFMGPLIHIVKLSETIE